MKPFPVQRLRGVWGINMEASDFFPGLDRLPTKKEAASPGFWLEMEGSSDPRIKAIRAKGYGFYAIDMLARVPPMEGSYGHMGIYKRGALLERVLSIRLLYNGALPPNTH